MMLSQISRALRRMQSAAPFLRSRNYAKGSSVTHEYFVVVWDKPGSGRITDIPSDLAPPFYTFAGEILNAKSSNILNAEHAKARGNAFACIAQSPDMVREQMKKSVYYQKGIWDMDTVQISALETVHTGNLTVDQTIE